MEGFINKQREIQRIINNAVSNYKKSPTQRITREYLESRLENLERDWLMFCSNNSKMYEVLDSTELAYSVYAKEEVYDEVEEVYINYKTDMKIKLNKLDSSSKVCETSDPVSGSVAKVRLPKITIPMFSGKYSEWTTFNDLFISLVHNNSSLDNVQKMQYLKGHLTGEAEQLLRHIPTSNDNYSRCWSQLENRYNNKRYLANQILKRFFTQRRMNFESASALKDLLDTTNDCMGALINLKVDISTWDVIIIHILTYKLDPETRKQWEIIVSNDNSADLPTFEKFKVFIEGRFRALECIDQRKPSTHFNHDSQPPKTKALFTTNAFNIRCEFCSEGHKLCFCKQFIKLDYEHRHAFVAKNNICFNCLGANHTIKECQKPTYCKICKKRHHTLLHEYNESKDPEQAIKKRWSFEPDVSGPSRNIAQENKKQTEIPKFAGKNVASGEPSASGQIVTCHSTKKIGKPKQVLLATALIKAQSRTGEFQVVRAMLDQGSQASFITEDTVQHLRLIKTPINGVISGLGGNDAIRSTGLVTVVLQSLNDPKFKIQIKAYVLKKITTNLPERKVESVDWINIEGLYLADPQFDIPNKIHILLGADVYGQIIQEGVMKSTNGSLIAQRTILGWILSGVVNSESSNEERIKVMHAKCNEDEVLKKFWEIEEQLPNSKKLLTEEDQRCEEFFAATTRRTEDGRYVVKLPFREEVPSCSGGESRQIAVRRFKSLERKFFKDESLKKRYAEVIDEYLHLGHMKPVKKEDNEKDKAVYLPHHAIVKEDRLTTKVRVVFDASCKNQNGISLNDTLMVGPTLQPDLRHLIMRWRVHQIGLVADIEKMYRQVKVAEEDTAYQRIVWREDPEEQIQDYELLTVTFGTASAPYLAVKSLQQISLDEGKQYPLAADKVLDSFYMDDLLSGCRTVEEGVRIYKQMKDLLGRGGFRLQKWNSNSKDLLTEINKYENDTENEEIKDIETKDEVNIKLNATIKILGLSWNRRDDIFKYSVEQSLKSGPVTKRSIISDIARLYDPLGWLAPCVITAKIFIQRLWLAGIGWDEEVSNELLKEWETYRKQLSYLTKVRIPRWLGMTANESLIEIHGFSDASKLAYSAVIYIRAVDAADNIHVSLLVAKTKVAPIKQVSIPRLELCGALLLTRLLVEVAEVMRIHKDNIRAWTDSTVVLAWLNSHPSRWKTFVGNRVSEILTSLDSAQWAHVSSKDNPADCASRGVPPETLAENNLWLSGPQFLKEVVITYEKPKNLDIHLEESVKTHFAAVQESIWTRFSSLGKLLRIIAYCKRFLKYKKNQNGTKYLQRKEIDEALQCCIKQSQKEEFLEEYLQIKDKGYITSKGSKLKSLCPYIDTDDIIRVGGRLQKSQLDEEMKHPIVLPHNAHLSKLIVADAHCKTLHGGPQQMINYIRSAYWIIGVKALVKHHVRRCVICVRNNAIVKTQLMGSLPSVRCTPSRPFLCSGLDYAGPINLRTTKGRGHRSYKGYICLFICMSTRAIHLEVVSDMSTQGFLAAFRRFVSRRGHCAQIWSDNGSNFIGAARELQQLCAIQPSIAEHLETNGTEWHFIPPHAPNFGGLWEAGVKSTKFHLKRVIGDSTLTYEEMSTLLNQIEACLNSRPMTMINTEDPSEACPLTPAHFLVGGSLVTVPDADYENRNISCLTRWQLVQKMVQNFWRRWSQEYLATLLQRHKWAKQIPEPNVGDVVLIKEDNLPPSRWLLGRIITKHPGHDNLTRVVTLRTKSSLMKRPISKLCALPNAE